MQALRRIWPSDLAINIEEDMHELAEYLMKITLLCDIEWQSKIQGMETDWLEWKIKHNIDSIIENIAVEGVWGISGKTISW